MTELCPRDRLLLLCAHVALEATTQGELSQLLDTDMDWQDVVGRARAHGIHPYLYHHIRTIGSEEKVPADVWNHLHKAYAAAAARWMMQRRGADRVLGALAAAGIDVIPLKALALWDTVYPIPALRLSADLDLLVPRDAIAQAARTLQEIGCVADDSKPLDWFRPEVSHHIVAYRLPDHPVWIEIHWSIVAPRHGYGIDLDGLWARSVPAQVAGHAVRILSAEDMLLHLCIHSSVGSRFLHGLRHLMDIAEVTRAYSSTDRPGIDWDALVARADAWGVRPLVYLALRLADDLLRIEKIHDRLAALQPASFHPDLVFAARERVLALAPGMAESLPQLAADDWLRAMRDEPLSVKLRLLTQLFFLPRSEMAERYGVSARSPWLLACYALQPFQLLQRRFATLGLDLLRRDCPTDDTRSASRKEQALLDYWLRYQRLPLRLEP